MKAREVVIYVFAGFVIVFTLAPFIWMIISSISSTSELLAIPVHWIPQKPTIQRYVDIILSRGGSTAALFNRGLLNSFIISSAVTLICLFTGTFAGYAFTRLRFPGRGPLLYFFLFTNMAPPIAIVISLYFIYTRIGLFDTKLGLILIYSSLITPFVVWLMRGYFLSIPRDLEDAALIDGCSRFGTLFRIIIPLSIPGLIATGILSFLMAWEEFLFALILTNSETAKTITVIIAEFIGKHYVDYGMITAGGVLAALPPVLVALAFSRYIIRGLTRGAVKG